MLKFECLIVQESYRGVMVEADARDGDEAWDKAGNLNHDELFEDAEPAFIETRVEDVVPVESE